jgi:hypothetical protein
MKTRMAIFGLAVLGIPVSWMLGLPHYAFFVSLLCFILMTQSLIYMAKRRDYTFGWAPPLFFAIGTGVTLMLGQFGIFLLRFF